MADGGEAFDAYPGALAARRAADPENLAKVLEFRRALRAGCAYGGAALVPVLHAEGHGSERPMKPHVIGMVRSPAASAASLCRRDKLDFNHAISIWLRYMLDFEKIHGGGREGSSMPQRFVRRLRRPLTAIFCRWRSRCKAFCRHAKHVRREIGPME